jgi:hypothetical protein
MAKEKMRIDKGEKWAQILSMRNVLVESVGVYLRKVFIQGLVLLGLIKLIREKSKEKFQSDV